MPSRRPSVRYRVSSSSLSLLSMLRGLLHLALFLAALFATAAGLRSLDPMPFWGWMRSKVAHVHQHGGDWLSDQNVAMHTLGQFVSRCQTAVMSRHSVLERTEQLLFVGLHTLATSGERAAADCRQARPGQLSEFGQKYEVRGSLLGPSGRAAAGLRLDRAVRPVRAEVHHSIPG